MKDKFNTTVDRQEVRQVFRGKPMTRECPPDARNPDRAAENTRADDGRRLQDWHNTVRNTTSHPAIKDNIPSSPPDVPNNSCLLWSGGLGVLAISLASAGAKVLGLF